MRVLLVDDDPEQRALVRRLFEDEGFVLVDEAGDGEAALVAVDRAPPDLVVLDLMMPGRSGFDVLPELQRRAPQARVVVLSNLPRSHVYDAVRDLGALGFVEKRTAPAVLVAEILMTAVLTDIVLASATVDLTATSHAARDARRFIRDALRAVDVELVDAVELLVSELVTNAVVHASTAPRLAVRVSPANVRVEVHDDDPHLPSPLPPDDTRISGRGLYIVDQLATRWGAQPGGRGKVVWFELSRAGAR